MCLLGTQSTTLLAAALYVDGGRYGSRQKDNRRVTGYGGLSPCIARAQEAFRTFTLDFKRRPCLTCTCHSPLSRLPFWRGVCSLSHYGAYIDAIADRPIRRRTLSLSIPHLPLSLERARYYIDDSLETTKKKVTRKTIRVSYAI
jgi:hypothetical protein